MKINNFFRSIVLFLFIPLVGRAQPTKLTETYKIFDSIGYIVDDILIPIAFTASLLLFFWGIVKYIKEEGDGKNEGKRIMLWGVVALFVASSVWGIVYFLRLELGIGNQDVMNIPKFNY